MCTAFFTLWELACPLQQKDKNASSGIFLFYRSNLQFPKRLWVVHFFSARQYAFLPIFSPPHEDFDPSLSFDKKNVNSKNLNFDKHYICNFKTIVSPKSIPITQSSSGYYFTLDLLERTQYHRPFHLQIR